MLRFPQDFPVSGDRPIPSKLLHILESGSIVKVEMPSSECAWLITGYHNVRRCLLDPALSRAIAYGGAPRLFGDDITSVPGCVFNMEGRRHQQLRGAISPLFTESALRHWEFRAGVITERLFRDISESSAFDATDAIAKPLVLRLVSEMLGLSVAEAQTVRALIAEQTSLVGDPKAVRLATENIVRLAETLLMNVPQHGLFSTLSRQGKKSAAVREDERVGTAAMLLFNVVEPMVPILAFAMARSVLCMSIIAPDGTIALPATPDISLLRGVIAEVLRFYNNGPINMPRVAVSKVDIGAVSIKRGDAVLTSTLSAGWDGSVYANPEAFDPWRRTYHSLAFGTGRHRCMGAEFVQRVSAVVAGRFLALLAHRGVLAIDSSSAPPLFNRERSSNFLYSPSSFVFHLR
ncbi:cytochrome P450 [Nocardia sp. NPDC060249]|uniref:cytochrome P450 n=1 Tax=Nocardia sp. NPDC060249 TaxID=3347082 RepID=UPI003655D256